MSAKWKCPRCETINEGDICEICNYVKGETETEIKSTKQQHNDREDQTVAETAENKAVEQEKPVQASETIKRTQKSGESEKLTQQQKPEKPVQQQKTEKTVQPKKTAEPPKSPEPETPKVENSTVNAPTKKGAGSKIVGTLAAAAVLAALVMNGTKANEYESNWDVFMNNFRDEDSQIEHYLEKGREALDDVEANAAEYFFGDKVLALDPDNEEAIVGCIRANGWQDDNDQTSKYIVKLSEAVDEVSDENEFYVNSAVEELCQADYDAMASAIEDNTVTEDAVNAFFASYQEYAQRFTFRSFQNMVAEKYADIYHQMEISGTPDAMKVYFLTAATTYFPDNSDLIGQKNALEKQMEEEQKIQKHLKEAYELFKSKDYEKMKKFIDESPYTDQDYYYVDGVYKKSVDSGHGMILDAYGIYVGDIADNRRNGSGIQFYYYEGFEFNYRVMDGEWSDDDLNGDASVTWFASNGTKAVTSGNFTNGFYDGQMTVKWDGWTGNFTADNGKITSGKMVDGEYRYAYVSNSSGASAWWYLDDPDARVGF